MIGLKLTVPSYALVYEKKKLRKVFRAAGAEVAAVAKAMIRRSEGGGRTYTWDGHRYQASTPGGAPVSRSGALVGGIKVRPYKSGEGVAIRDSVFYALFLEGGAKGGGTAGGKGARNRGGAAATSRVLLPRPFLSVAMESRREDIGKRIRDSIVNDIAFKRVKA